MPNVYPPFIFGMHDRGGEHLMLAKDKRGWVLVTEALGADPNNHSGSDFTDLSSQGLGVIVRLNHGYGTAGTLPYSAYYDDFARRCGNFVAASPGCHIWIIGNEPNLAWERPGGPNGQTITPELYAACFEKCRAEIHRRPGHAEDQVVVAAAGPWNTQTKYAGNPSGDWVRYFADILDLLGQNVDGMAIHTYTHGQDPGLVFSENTMNPPFQSYHWHFRAYRDFMGAIPDGLRNRPVYITEADQYDAWRDDNTGWVRNAYQEIDNWNRNPDRQPIQALILFRWIIGNPNDPQQVGWAIENKPGVQDDFREAMNNAYRVILPQTKPEYRVAWLEVNAPTVIGQGATATFRVTVRNDGRRAWANSGTNAVRLGYRWISATGAITEGLRTSLPRSVAPGEPVTLPAVTVQAPQKPGYYTLELDLVEGVTSWFASKGSPVWRATTVRVGPRYRAAWLEVAAPSRGRAGETVSFLVRMRNEGALTWPPTGDHPVNLTYKWLDADRQVVVADGLRTPIGRTVAPLQEVVLDAAVQFPSEPGQYILQMDMVHEFVVWFQWKGSPVHEVQVEVEPAAPEYAAAWLDSVIPQRLTASQTASAYLEVKNIGSKAWPASGTGAIRLGYRWLDAQAQEVPVAGAKTQPLVRTIEPGGVATFRDVAFIAPQTPGSYRLLWDLNQEGTWLSTRGVAVIEQPIQVLSPEFGVEWEMLAPWPEQMPPGEEQHASMRLHNLGTRPWSASGDHPVHLAYHWFTEDARLSEPWDTFRIPLPRDVPRGATVELTDVAFKTPPVQGRYVLRWDLVEEGYAWFFRQGGIPLEVPVEVVERGLFVPWNAKASHNADEAKHAFDGDPNTVWDSRATQRPGMWFQVDLGRVLVLDRIRIFSPGRGFPLGYRIKLSKDGQDWHLVAERAKNWSDVEVAFAPCEARYLHLEQTGEPSWPASWMISEITVSVTEPWSEAQASHYTAEGPRAIDARLETTWTTRVVKQKPGMWFRVDMGSLHSIERVSLVHHENHFPRGYVVDISTDGRNWQEVGREGDNWGSVDVAFPPITARYVRVTTTNSSAYYPWGIAEITLWRSSPIWLRGLES